MNGSYNTVQFYVRIYDLKQDFIMKYFEMKAQDLRKEITEKFDGVSWYALKLKKTEMIEVLENNQNPKDYFHSKYGYTYETQNKKTSAEKKENGFKIKKVSKPEISDADFQEYPEKTANVDVDGSEEKITDLIRKIAGTAIDENRVREIVREEIPEKEYKVVNLDVSVNGQNKKVEGQHKKFEMLLKIVSTKQNALLVGPAGSGKTSAAKKVAETLDLKYVPFSVSPHTTKTDIFGFTDASGKYIQTAFRMAFENGGLFLLDEVDSGNAGILTILNNAIDGRIALFPDGVIEAHDDFICVACANTAGRGANEVYNGRRPLDGAFLDRFIYVMWDYDKSLESKIADNFECPRWLLDAIYEVRENCTEHRIKHIVGTRAIIQGSKLNKAGFSKREILEMAVYKGLTESETVRVRPAIHDWDLR